MPYIDITVRGKIAQTDRAAFIVCGNKDYIARFDFGESSDWDNHATKTARFVRNDGTYTDVQFTGTECAIPVIVNAKSVSIGVFAGDLITSTGASVWCRKSIIDPDGLPADPPSDVYAQLMDRLDHVLDNGLPHKLTFTGASAGEYDGTADVTINIPEGGEGGGGSTDISLGISGATTGCVTVIETVDSNGKPTSYNALSIIDYANDIIGKSITLELQSATVGQIAKIKAVDSNGKPTEWEAADMPDASIPVVSKTSSDTEAELSPNTFYVFPEMASLSVTFSYPVSLDIVNEYKFRFTSGSTSTMLTLPSTVVGDITVEANKVYEISIVDNYLVYQSWAVS